MIEIGLDFKFFWQLVNFLIIMFLLNLVIYRPVRAVLKKRAEHNAQLRADIGQSREAVADSQEAVRARQAETRAAGLSMWEEYKNKARAEELAKMKEANSGNAAFLAQQRAELSTQIEMAGARLDHDTEQFARDIAGKLLQRSLS
ncbi:MAG: ATP synthase F0 subunit B [Desulfarculales bacterium]|jgi:F-type H+-transporting ATPase subunit b|nr:ATP synthase F0 subunit B [Desulfarculales bacterium]